MLGLTLEKLVLVGLVAALVVGPHRLPEHARRLAATLRSLRSLLDAARTQAETELGVPLDRARDLTRYQPRRLVQDALREPAAAAPGAAGHAPEPIHDPRVAEAASIRPGQVWLVTGSAAHPRRIRLADLPEGDPRRLASEAPAEADAQPRTATPSGAETGLHSVATAP